MFKVFSIFFYSGTISSAASLTEILIEATSLNQGAEAECMVFVWINYIASSTVPDVGVHPTRVTKRFRNNRHTAVVSSPMLLKPVWW